MNPYLLHPPNEKTRELAVDAYLGALFDSADPVLAPSLALIMPSRRDVRCLVEALIAGWKTPSTPGDFVILAVLGAPRLAARFARPSQLSAQLDEEHDADNDEDKGAEA